MDEDLKSASAAMDNTTTRPAYAPQNQKQRGRSVLKILIPCLIILICLGAGGFALKKYVLQKPKAAPAVVVPVKVTPKATNDIETAPLGQSYASKALSVSFKYPDTWKVSEVNNGIKIESPSFTYQSVNTGNVNGNFKIYIRQGARDTDRKYIGRGVAVKPSEKLNYTQPAIGQRTETLLSSFGLDSSDNFAFFMIAGNFQLQKDDTLGPEYGKEPETYIIAGGYGTPASVDDMATLPVSLEYYTTTNAYKQAIATIASLQLQ